MKTKLKIDSNIRIFIDGREIVPKYFKEESCLVLTTSDDAPRHEVFTIIHICTKPNSPENNK